MYSLSNEMDWLYNIKTEVELVSVNEKKEWKDILGEKPENNSLNNKSKINLIKEENTTYALKIISKSWHLRRAWHFNYYVTSPYYIVKKRGATRRGRFFSITNILSNYINTTKGVQLNSQIILNNLDFINSNSLSLIEVSPIALNLHKEIILLNQNKFLLKRQFFFFIKEFINTFQKTILIFVRSENFIFADKKNFFMLEKNILSLYSNYIITTIYNNRMNIGYSSNNTYLKHIFFNQYLNLFFNRIFSSIFDKSNVFKIYVKNNYIQDNIRDIKFSSIIWEEIGLLTIKNRLNNLNKNLNRKITKIKSKLLKRKANSTLFGRNIHLSTVYSNSFFLQNYLWKRNPKKSNKYLLGQNIKPLNKDNKFNFAGKKTGIHLGYIISRLDVKIAECTEVNQKDNLLKLQQLRNYLLILLSEKKDRFLTNKFLITRRDSIIRLKHRNWPVKLLSVLNLFIEKNSQNSDISIFVENLFKKLKPYLNNIKSKVDLVDSFNTRKVKVLNKNYDHLKSDLHFFALKRLFNKQISLKGRRVPVKKQETIQEMINNLYKRRLNKKIVVKKKRRLRFFDTKTLDRKKRKVSIRRTWVDNKLILSGRVLSLQDKKRLLSSLIGLSTNLFFINALSITKFAFKLERLKGRRNNNPNKYLSVLDRDFINKFKYVGIYIKDLIRVSMISMFFKKPSFLSKFVSFQLVKLPKNRKETSFIRFLIKVIKTFGAEREEITAVRLRFKGRVNRWRRTKFILGNRGTLPLGRMCERIELGSGTAINRKGAVGIRIWVRYRESFMHNLRNYTRLYFKYSKLVNLRKKKKIILLK